ncbi:hypothetical protein KPSA1_07608 [Pseudomonas syringae pv. actinidiae]|uniref:Uncharacterized protein n=1 Tax=Pseudomonas syringae pv. actinidiae TaxID=103796 RepID=A0A2V0QME6_PSESF|nr:hypothetical protein KPSA1_07608 [Pseudomonas syringae pv. actinidiae]
MRARLTGFSHLHTQTPNGHFCFASALLNFRGRENTPPLCAWFFAPAKILLLILPPAGRAVSEERRNN